MIGVWTGPRCRSTRSRFVDEANDGIVASTMGSDMAKFLVLIYGDERAWADAPASWHAANAKRHGTFHAIAGAAIVSANELEPSARAVSVRRGPAGRPSATDGPFLETKEVIGGYYVLEAPDLDEAVRLAGQLPEATAEHGGVEVRAIAPAG